MLLFKNIYFSFILILGTECSIKDSIKVGIFNLYKAAAILTREFNEKPVTYKNISYYLYTIYNPHQYIQLNSKNLNLFTNKKVVFFIHGWTNSKNVTWYRTLKNAFLKRYSDYYIVQVDWEGPANRLYYVSSINTSDVANIITRLILELIINYGIWFDYLLLIGHSLGGQITGLVGKCFYKTTGVKLPRIIALDPAGPLFTFRPENERLNKYDADVVEAIHTDGGISGYEDSVGTIDFFPNGGSSQPGCWDIDFFNISSYTDPIYCDHHRAYEYLVEAILHPREFIAIKCSDWDSYKDGKCHNNTKVSMGDITVKARGNFYLETKANTRDDYGRKLISMLFNFP